MQQNQLDETQVRFSARQPVNVHCRRRLLLAGGTAAAVLVLGAGGVFGWQKLTERTAKTTIAPAATTTTSRPQLPGPLNGVNPLPCTAGSRPPIKLKGHALPVCPPGAMGSPAATVTPAPAG